jgi:phosphate/sulfate permease
MSNNTDYQPTYRFCGTTNKVTSEDFASCELAYGSFVFSIVSGICIGSLSLSNIIGVAYINKKLTIASLIVLTCIFEAIGMLTISQSTLLLTITKTVDFENMTNLRKAYITLGSTQMCSMLFLINVLIFALPMSSTHVVISGLMGTSVIFYTETESNHVWFLEEFTAWFITPYLGMAMTLGCYLLVKKHIFEHPNARKRVVKLIPWYITITTTLMFYIPMFKNYFQFEAWRLKTDWSFPVLSCLLIVFPLLVLPISRWILLRRARSLHKHALMEQRLQYTNSLEEETMSASLVKE